MKRAIITFSASNLLPYIDWSYFFHAWGIRPKDYKSQVSIQLKDDAIEVAKEGTEIRTLFALCDAYSNNEDIIIEGVRLPLLRQQHCDKEKPNLCLSDFISPTADKLGIFATSTKLEERVANEHNDSYRRMLVQTVADRLAEAAASFLHKKVRTDAALWGYAPDENTTIEDMHREHFQGIRPAVGYPSLPDQSVIFILNDIVNLSEIGIELTDAGAMRPHASVCGLMFAHPRATYFAVGDISDEQLQDYAKRRAISAAHLKKFLVRNAI